MFPSYLVSCILWIVYLVFQIFFPLALSLSFFQWNTHSGKLSLQSTILCSSHSLVVVSLSLIISLFRRIPSSSVFLHLHSSSVCYVVWLYMSVCLCVSLSSQAHSSRHLLHSHQVWSSSTLFLNIFFFVFLRIYSFSLFSSRFFIACTLFGLTPTAQTLIGFISFCSLKSFSLLVVLLLSSLYALHQDSTQIKLLNFINFLFKSQSWKSWTWSVL